VPTLKEEGFEAMNFANWFGLVAPANVPPAITQRLAVDTAAVLRSADTRGMLQKLGVDVYPAMSAQEFQQFLDAEMARWGSVIRSANIKTD
jgi:tripartite-type tricarboxylate transporter receptor subunit TctC